MKCISIRQPWAYAIIYCGKNIENRSWSTEHRGPLLIHASLSKVNLDRDLQYIEKHFNCVIPKDKLEFGKIIGAVKLNNVFLPDDLNKLGPWAESGQFHWWFENAVPLKPKAYKGSLGLFDVPIKNEEKIFKRIKTVNDIYNIS